MLTFNAHLIRHKDSVHLAVQSSQPIPKIVFERKQTFFRVLSILLHSRRSQDRLTRFNKIDMNQWNLCVLISCFCDDAAMGNAADDNAGGVSDMAECNEQFDSRRSRFWQLWVGPVFIHLQNEIMFLLWTFTFTKPKVQILEWFHLWVMHWRSQVSLMYISFSVSWYLRNTHGFFLTWLARCWFQDLKLFYTHCDHTFSPGDFQDCALMASVWHACGSNICTWKPYRVYMLQSQKFAGETGHQQQSRQSVMASEILRKLSLSSIGRSHNAWAFVFYGMFWLNQRVKDGRGTHAGIVERGVP